MVKEDIDEDNTSSQQNNTQPEKVQDTTSEEPKTENVEQEPIATSEAPKEEEKPVEDTPAQPNQN